MIKIIPAQKNKGCGGSLCSHVRTKWPVALLVISFALLFLIVFFKWVALDWIIEEKVTEVSGNSFTNYLLYLEPDWKVITPNL
jgi:hypothetical protein